MEWNGNDLLLKPTIPNIPAVRLRPRLRRPEEVPAPGLGRSRQQELHDGDTPAAFARELRVAEAGRDEVEDDVAFVRALLHARREFAAVKDLEEFGDGVSKVELGVNGYGGMSDGHGTHTWVPCRR